MARLGKNGVDWDGMSMNDHSRYMEIRRVLASELEDNLETVEFFNNSMENISPEEVCEKSLLVENVHRTLPKKHYRPVGSSTEDKLYLSLPTEIKLTDRELKVLELRMEGWYFEEIGQYFDVTKERIRQIELRAERKLRQRCFKNLKESHESIIF